MAHPHGLFSWADVSVPDPEAAKAFYTALFGWDEQDEFDPDGNYVYTMYSIDGKAVAGMGPQMDENMPPAWLSYLSVSDVDAVAADIEDNGGQVVLPPMDVFTMGRMAVAMDPTGAAFALWQAGDHPGGESFDGHGTMTWNELYTRDVDQAREFYAAVFPWSYQTMPIPAGDYHVIDLDVGGDEVRQNGAMMQAPDDMPAEVPPHWIVYFNVDDCEESAAKVRDLGGSIHMDPFDAEGVGKIAMGSDPSGAAFAIIEQVQAG